MTLELEAHAPILFTPSFRALPPEHLVEELDRALSLERPRLSRSEVPAPLLQKPTIAALTVLALKDWAAIGVLWAAMTVTPGWLYPLWAILLAGRFHAFGVILHDATHMPLRGKSPELALLELLTGYPIATTLNAMRYHHLRHHKDSGMPSDPYWKKSVRGRPVMYLLIWLRHLLLVPFWTVRGPFGLLSLAFPRMRNIYGRAFLQDRSGQDLTESRELIACARAELGQVLFHFAIYGALVVWPETMLWYYFLPICATGLFAGYRVLNEHNYLPTTDRKMETIVATTRDHNLGPLGRLFFAPRNIGYHIVHHLHPQAALWALPELRRWYLEHHPETYPAAERRI